MCERYVFVTTQSSEAALRRWVSLLLGTSNNLDFRLSLRRMDFENRSV